MGRRAESQNHQAWFTDTGERLLNPGPRCLMMIKMSPVRTLVRRGHWGCVSSLCPMSPSGPGSLIGPPGVPSKAVLSVPGLSGAPSPIGADTRAVPRAPTPTRWRRSGRVPCPWPAWAATPTSSSCCWRGTWTSTSTTGWVLPGPSPARGSAKLVFESSSEFPSFWAELAAGPFCWTLPRLAALVCSCNRFEKLIWIIIFNGFLSCSHWNQPQGNSAQNLRLSLKWYNLKVAVLHTENKTCAEPLCERSPSAGLAEGGKGIPAGQGPPAAGAAGAASARPRARPAVTQPLPFPRRTAALLCSTPCAATTSSVSRPC